MLNAAAKSLIAQRTLDDITETIELLRGHATDKRFAILKDVAEQSGGSWDLPGGNYRPTQCCITVYGISALADNVDGLADEWIRAARVFLEGEDRAKAQSLKPASSN